MYALPYIQGYNEDAKTKEEKAKNTKIKDGVFRKRDLDQILREGYYPTCSDKGVLFRGLMIAQGIPTSYIEVFHDEFLFDKAFHGHVMARVFDGEGSIIVDPKGEIMTYDSEIEIFPYVIFREGLDSWDIGVRSYQDLFDLRIENLPNLLDKYEEQLEDQYQQKKRQLQEFRKGANWNIDTVIRFKALDDLGGCNITETLDEYGKLLETYFKHKRKQLGEFRESKNS